MFYDARPEAELDMVTYLTLYTPLLLLCVARLEFPGRVGRWIETAGNMTYASYLLHFPIQITAALICLWASVAIPYREPWVLLSFLALTFTASVVIFRRFEVPVQDAIRLRLLNTRSSTTPHGPSPAPLHSA